MASTTNYGWIVPTVGGDTGAWGTVANTLYQAVDTALKAVSVVASAALAKAGGVMSGKLDLWTSSAKRIDLGSVSGAIVIDLSLAQVYTLTVGGNLTPTFTNVPAGSVTSAVLFNMTNAGNFTITWPTVTPLVKWPGGTAPVWTLNGRDRVAFITDDAGVTADGIVLGKAFA